MAGGGRIVPRTEGIHVDGQVIAFTSFACLVTSLIFGLLPAFRTSRVDLAAAINPDRPALRVLRAALRDASLTGAMACLVGWDACLTPDPGGNAAAASQAEG